MKGREFVRIMGHLRGVQNLEVAVAKAIALVDLADAQHRQRDAERMPAGIELARAADPAPGDAAQHLG